MTDREERINKLREYEQDCYSICYYVLQCEKSACEAAKDALCRLYQSERFFAEDPVAVQQALRNVSIACALQLGNRVISFSSHGKEW